MRFDQGGGSVSPCGRYLLPGKTPERDRLQSLSFLPFGSTPAHHRRAPHPSRFLRRVESQIPPKQSAPRSRQALHPAGNGCDILILSRKNSFQIGKDSADINLIGVIRFARYLPTALRPLSLDLAVPSLHGAILPASATDVPHLSKVDSLPSAPTPSVAASSSAETHASRGPFRPLTLPRLDSEPN